MLIEQIWTGNRLRNFNYLVACPESGEALAIDPLDHQRCLATAQQNQWRITQVLNTHEHGDHTGGNAAVIAASGARLLAHADAAIAGIDIGLRSGDTVSVGSSIRLEALDTPGHTLTHICLWGRAEQSVLFSGDTLFNAGVGNCHNGGHPEQLYETFANILASLPDDTLVYPGHDYLENNLRFTLDREPGNVTAQKMLETVINSDVVPAIVTDLGMERKINTFLRLDNRAVIDHLRTEYPELGARPDAREVFLKLRALRNAW